MHVLPYIFIIMKYCGIWRPLEWTSGWKKNGYWIYTSLVIVAIYTFSISEAVYAYQCMDDLEEMANSSFMLLTMACVVCKANNILSRRRDIVRFTNILKNDNCRANGPHEVRIMGQFHRRMKQTTLWYVSMVGSSVGTIWAGSFLTDVPRRSLAFNAWVPFNYATPTLFWSVYVHQIFAHVIGAAICVAYDTLLWGMISQACTQMKILKSRLQFLPHDMVDQTSDEEKLGHNGNAQEVENKLLARCINHHRDIFDFADSVNETFSVVIFMQCAVSTVVLCISIYALSRMKPFTTEFTSIVLYIFCMLVQIFVYCWFGNQIIIELKSGSDRVEYPKIYVQSMDVGNAVYAMDWMKLSVGTQKNLLVVMIRSVKPIKFSSGNIIILSLDTFISLLKLSYSTFNLLQQTSE